MGSTKNIKYPQILLFLLAILLLMILTVWRSILPFEIPNVQEVSADTSLPFSPLNRWPFDLPIVWSISILLFLWFLQKKGAWFLGAPIAGIVGLILIAQPSISYYITQPMGLELLLDGIWTLSLMGLLFGYKRRWSLIFLLAALFTKVYLFGILEGVYPILLSITLRVFHERGKEISLSAISGILLVWVFAIGMYMWHLGVENGLEYLPVKWYSVRANSYLLSTLSYPLLFFSFYLLHLLKTIKNSLQNKEGKLFAWSLWFALSGLMSLIFLRPFIILPLIFGLSIAVYRDWKTPYRKTAMRVMAMVQLLGLMAYILFIYLGLSSIDTLSGLLPGIVTGIVLLAGIVMFLIGYEMGRRRIAFYILAGTHYLFVIGYLLFF